MSRTLVVGLGNPILRDDGVGWRVVEQVEANHGASASDCEFDYLSLGGLALMERMIGYERVILVDAIQTVGGQPGAILRLDLAALPTLNANAVHDVSLKTALDLGRKLGAALPEQGVVVAIQAVDLLDFGEDLSPTVEASVAPATRAVLAELTAAGA